eukprot:10364315-Alexandrium_andersonii.AAC.1
MRLNLHVHDPLGGISFHQAVKRDSNILRAQLGLAWDTQSHMPVDVALQAANKDVVPSSRERDIRIRHWGQHRKDVRRVEGDH